MKVQDIKAMKPLAAKPLGMGMAAWLMLVRINKCEMFVVNILKVVKMNAYNLNNYRKKGALCIIQANNIV